MARLKVNQVLSSTSPVERVLIKGWIRTRRDSRDFSFLEVNDGSCLNNLQVIADAELDNYDEVKKLSPGSAVAVTGSLLASAGKGQMWEVKANRIEILGLAPETYPLQKKRHTDEYLRGIAHLRPRTNKYGAAFRIRSALSWAIHRFFRERGFHYIHTPIITASDCEGAGEMFRVTTLDDKNPPLTNGQVDYGRDFFGAMSNLC